LNWLLQSHIPAAWSLNCQTLFLSHTEKKYSEKLNEVAIIAVLAPGEGGGRDPIPTITKKCGHPYYYFSCFPVALRKKVFLFSNISDVFFDPLDY
jgi:hypothetical protein